MMGFWFILVASIVATWSSSYSVHRFEPESEDFIFHILQRNFSNFGMRVLVMWSSEFLFLLVLFSAGIYLFKVWLKGSKIGYIYIYIYIYFLFSSGIYLFKLIKITGSFSKATIFTNKDHLVLFFSRQGLHIACKSYYNLSIQRENYQLDEATSLM